MSGAARASHPINSLSPGDRVICLEFTTTGGGTINATATKATGATVVKTAAKVGRYTIQCGTALEKNTYAHLVQVLTTVVGPADLAMTAGSGIVAITRNDTLSTAGTIDVQFLRPDTYVDAEVQANARVLVTLIVSTMKYRY